MVSVEAVGTYRQVRPVPLDGTHRHEDERRALLCLYDLGRGEQLVFDPGHGLRSPLCRDARNICVSTSMSSRACSGGVRHGSSSVTQPWKCSSSRAKLSS